MRARHLRHIGAAVALSIGLIVGTVGIAAAGGGSTKVKTQTTTSITAQKASGKVKIKGNVPNKAEKKCITNRKVKIGGPEVSETASAAGIPSFKLGTDRTDKKGKWSIKPPSGKQFDTEPDVNLVTVAKKQVTVNGAKFICKQKNAVA